jgi:single-stranded-DNA-specific exonuclease
MTARQHMRGFGGHAHAIGLHVDLANVERLRVALNSYAQAVLNTEDFVQTIIHDGDCDLERVTEAFIDEIDRAAPFGRGNPEPVFLFRQVRFFNLKELRGGHLRGTMSKRKEMPFVAFGRRDQVIENNMVGDVLGTVEVNEWNQNKTLQLRVRDVRIA